MNAFRFAAFGLVLASTSLAAGGAEPAAPASTSRASLPLEKCGVVYAGVDGNLANMMLPSIHVIDLADAAVLKLPGDAPPNVKAVTCGRRDSLVPAKNDYKVLQAGYPFSIVNHGRMGTLTIADGKVRFDMQQGEMTADETPKIGAVVDAAQAALANASK
jgi:hypothetical protein